MSDPTQAELLILSNNRSCCNTSPQIISNSPYKVDGRIFSPKNILINNNDRNGEINIRLEILAVLSVSFIAVSHKTKVKPISNTPI